MNDKENSKGLHKIVRKHKKRIDRMKEIESQGGNKYQQLEARLMNEETGKLIMCPVIYAIQILKERKDVLDFYQGYFNEVKNNLDKYKLGSENDAKKFVLNDINTALNIHFYEKKTHKLWNPILKSQLKK